MENNLTCNQVLEDAENQIREACEILQREATRLSRRLSTSMLAAAVLRQVFKR